MRVSFPFSLTTVLSNVQPCRAALAHANDPVPLQAQLAHIARRFQVDLLHGMSPPHPRTHDRPRLRPPPRLLRPPAPPLAFPPRPAHDPSWAPSRTRRARVVRYSPGWSRRTLRQTVRCRACHSAAARHLGAALVLYAGMFAAAGAVKTDWCFVREGSWGRLGDGRRRCCAIRS